MTVAVVHVEDAQREVGPPVGHLAHDANPAAVVIKFPQGYELGVVVVGGHVQLGADDLHHGYLFTHNVR